MSEWMEYLYMQQKGQLQYQHTATSNLLNLI